MTARFWLTGLAPQRAPMTRILFSACVLLAAVAASTSAALSLAVPGAGTAGAVAPVGTPLPPGWELCVLAGVNAPATKANVSDLDEWQVAEGGSTNNTAAYNPFNTRRTTDPQGAPLPVTSMVGGFPAFPDWLTGCSATVATLLQPNMWVITAALRAGNVAPPGQFLVDVDGSAWCAPSATGQPCYETAIAASGGSIPGVSSASLALTVYGNVQSDLRAYQDAKTTVASQQGTQVALALQVVKAQTRVATAQAHYEQVEHELGTFAVSEYIHNGLYDANALAGSGSTSESQTGLAAQQYTKVAATDMVDRVQAASAAMTSAQGNLAGADRGLQRAGAALLADEAAENHALEKLIDDTSTLQTAGACTTVSILNSPSGSSAGNAATTGSTTTTTTTTSTTTTTTASTTVPSTAPPTSSTTTTSTTAPSTTTTTTGAAAGAPGSGASTQLPADRAGSTTTTTGVPTTTTTSPAQRSKQGGSSTATPAQVSPGGLGALQGCVSALSPRSSNA
jgi:hypothetical protein